MTKYVLYTVFLSFAAMTVAAQDAPREAARERFQEMQDRLKLSPEQMEKIRPILQDQAEKVRDIRANHSGDTSRRGRMQQARALRGVQQDTEKQINPLLTKEQQQEWKKIREERREEFRERRKQQ